MNFRSPYPRRNFDRNNKFKPRNYNRSNETEQYPNFDAQFHDETEIRPSNNTNNDYFLD